MNLWSGIVGQGKCLEAIQIVPVRKGSKAPASSYRGARQATAAPFKQR